MKCPKCGGGVTVSFPRDFGFVHRCNCCGKEWNSRKAVDPLIYEQALRIAAKENIESDLMLEEIYTTGNPDAYKIEIPIDITKQIEQTVQDYLSEAREGLDQ